MSRTVEQLGHKLMENYVRVGFDEEASLPGGQSE